MARLLLGILMVCACFCVTGCSDKKDSDEKSAEKKVHRAADEVETTIGVMNELN